MSKHTPRPWSIENGTDIIGIENDPANGCVGPVDVAHVYQRTVAGRTEANALLIAAAPDLLKALIDARQGLKSEREMLFEFVRNFCTGTIDDPQDAEEVGLLDSRINYVDCVIAKATGESA